jgi:tetratricopeptide (TPR) repeat protein
MGGPTKDTNLNSGIDALSKKQWNQAIAFFDKTLQANPDNVQALVGRSKANVQLGNMDKAVADVETAIKKNPTAQAFAQRGLLKKLQKKNDEALKDFTEAIKLNSNFAWAYAQRADLYSREKDQEKALQDINKAIGSKADVGDAYRLRVWILNRMGKCKEASEDIKKVEQLSPNNAWTIQDKAWFLLTCPDEKLQDPTKAMELAKKALELTGGKDGLVHETVAEAYFRQGDALKAAEHQKKAIELGSTVCPDGSCLKEMQQRLQKYELAGRQEVRSGYEIVPVEGGL